jgi:hypothetical protein
VAIDSDPQVQAAPRNAHLLHCGGRLEEARARGTVIRFD